MSILCSALFGALALSQRVAASPPALRPNALNQSLYWMPIQLDTDEQFRGLSVVSNHIAWAVGSSGSILRTKDMTTWENVGPDWVDLDFRDIHAFSAERAFALASGPGNRSQIFATDDGERWRSVFYNLEEEAFFNCLAFENPHRGLVAGDPVDGVFRMLETKNGGQTFEKVKDENSPVALDGEVGFSASGSCLSTMGGRWYFATGGVDPGRILHSPDGRNWEASDSGISGGETGGVYGVHFRNSTHGTAVGGDYTNPNGTEGASTSAWSTDGGLTWHPSEVSPGEYRSSVAWLPSDGIGPVDAIAVGPTGSDYTMDGGRTWYKFDEEGFDAVECVSGATYVWSCWASGAGGRVGRLSLRRREES